MTPFTEPAMLRVLITGAAGIAASKTGRPSAAGARSSTGPGGSSPGGCAVCGHRRVQDRTIKLLETIEVFRILRDRAGAVDDADELHDDIVDGSSRRQFAATDRTGNADRHGGGQFGGESSQCGEAFWAERVAVGAHARNQTPRVTVVRRRIELPVTLTVKRDRCIDLLGQGGIVVRPDLVKPRYGGANVILDDLFDQRVLVAEVVVNVRARRGEGLGNIAEARSPITAPDEQISGNRFYSLPHSRRSFAIRGR